MDLGLVAETAKILGPTGVLASVWLTIWLKNRNVNGTEARSAVHKTINEDHDILVEIRTDMGHIKDTVAIVETDVKALIKESHTHPVP